MALAKSNLAGNTGPAHSQSHPCWRSPRLSYRPSIHGEFYKARRT
jgi:hypothetical protein